MTALLFLAVPACMFTAVAVAIALGLNKTVAMLLGILLFGAVTRALK